MSTNFAVIGSTGKTGRRVADLLEAEGFAVRRLSRGTSPAFDWEHPERWADALRGIDRVYAAYVPDLAAPGSETAIARLADVAADAGVERIVLLSGRGEDGARRCEDILLASSVPATIVRASWFAQNFTEGMLSDATVTGVLALPAADVREPFIDVDDVAAVAVAALTEPGAVHANRIHEVTGPESLTFAEVAAIMSETTGREVAYLPMGFDEFHAAMAAEAGEAVATLLTELCRETFDGRNVLPTDGVVAALGRPPRDVRSVLRAAATAATATAADGSSS
ncbi:NmrA family transcriptional regulator [Agromyces sp. Root1464]|uniref:SDR family oxidoreductase n=1 Tax=Agromyces sp. Root1464 TaxID=1736467 RepID=UPI0006F922A1|nr:NmrA family NAD(P)-binding protein [Agromyces sp. Root1464]KQZ10835.1 NmrA family transcriptional regulator [Agromyces sp. Root1464]